MAKGLSEKPPGHVKVARFQKGNTGEAATQNKAAESVKFIAVVHHKSEKWLVLLPSHWMIKLTLGRLASFRRTHPRI